MCALKKHESSCFIFMEKQLDNQKRVLYNVIYGAKRDSVEREETV